MGAGILPVTLIKGSLFFLLGREHHHNNYWCDFGGSANFEESAFETGIREGYEELGGFLGNKNELESLVTNNLISLCYTKRYTTFVFYVKPQLLCPLPYYFNNNRKFLENELILDYKKEGLFEKNQVKLFNKKDILVEYEHIRPFYRKILPQLLELDKNSLEKYI